MEARQRFEQDKTAAKRAIGEAEAHYQQVLAQLQYTAKTSEGEKKRLTSEMEGTRGLLSRKLGETERETNRLMTEYESHLGALDVKFKCEAERGRQRLDGMVRENSSLRGYANGFSAICTVWE